MIMYEHMAIPPKTNEMFFNILPIPPYSNWHSKKYHARNI